jgi:addiction module RelE/StbE family toxin
MKVRWSPTAVSDLESIRDYIARDSPSAARKIANRIKESINRLIDFPSSGRAGRVPGTRELVVPGISYVVAYTVHGDGVQIASVLHGNSAGRNPSSFLFLKSLT